MKPEFKLIRARITDNKDKLLENELPKEFAGLEVFATKSENEPNAWYIGTGCNIWHITEDYLTFIEPLYDDEDYETLFDGLLSIGVGSLIVGIIIGITICSIIFKYFGL